MGGSEADRPRAVEWLDTLDAEFDAAVARDEEAAAADLAFSLRQDADVRAAVERSGCGWSLIDRAEIVIPVDEVGIDYVGGGTLLARSAVATLRSGPGPTPRITDRTFLEALGARCRAGAHVVVDGAAGRLVRVANDHVAIRRGDAETLVGIAALRLVRFGEGPGYSASRGFRG